MMKALEGLMNRSLARQEAAARARGSMDALMPSIGEGAKEKLPEPAHISTPPTGQDRLLTEAEKEMYRRIKGVYPPSETRLSEFRQMMGKFRKGGGFQ